MKVTEVSSEHGAELAALFERTGSPCFCRWWHFGGDKNGWLDRCGNRPHENRDEMLAALSAGEDSMRGVVALDDDGTVIGWMKLAPAAAMSKVYDQRLYRGLPVLAGDREKTGVVGCFLVDEAHRGRGVAHALLAGGIALARRLGLRVIDAFPRRAEGVGGEELWTGPFSTFARAGFVVVHEFQPYPVLRLELDRGSV